MIEEYIVLGVIQEVAWIPLIVAGIDVIAKSGYDPVTNPWRLRLLWDGRPLNGNLAPPSFEMESLESMRGVIEEDDCLLTFDVAVAFYHLLILKRFRPLLGFRVGGRCFVWRGAPMGKSSTPYSWCSLLWPLMRKWRVRFRLRLINFVDDLGVLVKRWEAEAVGRFIMSELEVHGLLAAEVGVKCILKPRRAGVLLGVMIDLERFVFAVPDTKKVKILRGIVELLSLADEGSAVPLRLLAKTAGRINALYIAMGTVVRFMLREVWAFMAGALGLPADAKPKDIRFAWNQSAVLSPVVVERLVFFRDLIPGHKGVRIRPASFAPRVRVVFGCDVSYRSWCGWIDTGEGWRAVARDVLREGEELWSSTAREGVGEVRALQALSAVLQGVLSRFESQVLLVLCDNQSVVRALEFGSRTPAVQAQVVQVHMWAMRSSVSIEPRWSGRDSEPMAFSDDGSKLHKLAGTELDPCDFMLSPAVFARIEAKYSLAHSFDRFASEVNRQGRKRGMRFSSLLFCPGAASEDAFATSWAGEDNWLFPPFACVGRVVRRLRDQRAKGTLVAPWYARAVWWPLVSAGAQGVVWREELGRRDGLVLRQGSVPVPAARQRYPLMAFRLDFTAVARRAGTLTRGIVR